MRNISDYKVIRTNKRLQDSDTILAQVNFRTRKIHIKKMDRTTLNVIISKVLTKIVKFESIEQVEKFLLYHEIRHIELKESMEYIRFQTKIEEEIECNLFSLKELELI